MHYRLGSLPLHALGMTNAFRIARAVSPAARLEYLRHLMQQQRCGHGQTPRAPDLLELLRHDPGEDDWVSAFAAALDEVRRHQPLSLACCERVAGPGGHVAIAVIDESHHPEVRVGDPVSGGLAAVRNPDGELAIWPRIHRKVCSNGAAVFTHWAEEVLRTTGSVRQAVTACLAPATTERAVTQLRAAAQTPIADPLRFVDRLDLPITPRELLLAREEDDETLYGWLNALTARARAEPVFAQRLAMERGAELFLDATPARPAAADEQFALACDRVH